MLIVKMGTTGNDGARLNVTRLKKTDLKVELTINNIKMPISCHLLWQIGISLI